MQNSARKKSQSVEKFSLGKKRPYPDSENDSNTLSHKRYKTSDSEGEPTFHSTRREKSGRLRGKSESKTFEVNNHAKLLTLANEHSENSLNEPTIRRKGVNEQEAVNSHEFVKTLFPGNYPNLQLPQPPEGVEKFDDGNMRLLYDEIFFSSQGFKLRKNDVFGLLDRKHIGNFNGEDVSKSAHLYRF